MSDIPSSLRIVLSEDDLDDQDFFREILQTIPLHTELVIANDGRELMDVLYLMETPPDVVFMDINMPYKNGLECLMEIRHDKKLNEIPVVILSTTMQKRTVEITYELGANLYIAKPNEVDKFRQVINDALLMNWLVEPRVSRDKFFIKL